MMISPLNMALMDWADSVVSVLSTTWVLGRLASDDQWQEWAVGLVRAPVFAQRGLPDPYQFSDWREWAMRAYPFLEEVV